MLNEAAKTVSFTNAHTISYLMSWWEQELESPDSLIKLPCVIPYDII
jgi:hypothetical protein